MRRREFISVSGAAAAVTIVYAKLGSWRDRN